MEHGNEHRSVSSLKMLTLIESLSLPNLLEVFENISVSPLIFIKILRSLGMKTQYHQFWCRDSDEAESVDFNAHVLPADFSMFDLTVIM